MQRRRLRTWAMAAATVGLVMLGASKRAAADIEIFVTAPGFASQAFDLGTGNNTAGSTPIFTIDGYSTQINTVVTNYPGTSSLGTISTTINILGAVTSPVVPLTTTVMLVSSFSLNGNAPLVGGAGGGAGYGSLTDPLLQFTAPTTTPVIVSAGSSFTTAASVSAGVATTETYYNSPGATSFTTSTPLVSSTQNFSNTLTPANFNQVSAGNPGPMYTLSQQLMLTGINVGATGFNYGGTSSVTAAVPEPSSLVLAGLGALGMIGYGLRRRKALGA
jgi:hypothetical protein